MRKKNKSDLVRSWLEKVRRDLAVAIREMRKKEPFTDVACFHAQQAIEKALKGYLAYHDIDFPKTHNIEDLIDLCMKKDESFVEFQPIAEKLTTYAIEPRYPEFEEPSIKDAKQAVEIAKKIVKFVKDKLPKECLPPKWKI